MTFKLLLLLFIPLFFASCDNDPRHIDTKNLPTHNKKVFDEGRYCSDYLKFECIPDSHDPKILKGNEPLADGKFPFYDWDEKKFRTYALITGYEDPKKGEKVEHYVLTKADYKWMDKVVIKQWYKEMEAKMEEQYPGFWGDTPRIVRHRWMRLCVAKAMKYGYGLKKKRTEISQNPYRYIDEILLDENGKPYCVSSTIRENQQWIELCGRIGLNFDREPKWKYIVDFIKHPDSVSMGHAGEAVTYIDFTVYHKDMVAGADYPITDWVMRTSLSHLPYPNRPVPRQDDQREGIDVVRAVE